jgi:hypothetical protein
VTVEGLPSGDRATLERQIGERLDPLVMKHETVWR